MTTRGQKSGGLVPGGAAALAGIGCLFGAGLFLDESARHWHVPAALVAGACACFGLAAVQSRRANRRTGARPAAAGRPVTRASLRPALWVFHIGFVVAAALAGFGGY